MEAKELRIGNLVQYNEVGECKVIGIHEFGIDVEFPEEITYMEYEAFSPIPLTEYWLLKFGGEKLPHFTVSNSIIIKTKRNQQLSFGCVGNPNFMVFIQEFNDDDKITDLIAIHNWDYDGEMYVHQLQNLYFALTGEELTIKN